MRVDQTRAFAHRHALQAQQAHPHAGRAAAGPAYVTVAAAAFSSSRPRLRVPGMATMCGAWASTQPSASCAGVTPLSRAMASACAVGTEISNPSSPV